MEIRNMENARYKNIMFAIDTNTSGGAERVMATIVNYFSVNNYNVIFVNSDVDSGFYKINGNVRIVKLGAINKNKYIRLLKKIYKLWVLIHNEKPDIVVPFLTRMEFPVIIIGLLTGTRVITSVRNGLGRFSWWEKLFRRLFYPCISGVVFQSRMVMNASDFKRVKNKCVISNPLAENYSKKVEILPRNLRKKWLINVGRLVNQKNQEQLIRCFEHISKKYPDYELHIFGKGELEDRLSNLIIEKDLKKKVVLEGEVQDAILRNKNAYAFVLNSNYEGCPNALIEAMAVGIPVICTDFDSGVARELIINGENGFLCGVNDEYDLRKKIEDLLCLNDEAYYEMAINASNISNILSSSRICEQWERFFLEVCD